MAVCTFRFYDGLCDFLARERKGREFDFSFTGTPSIKDTIEAAGVPHAEVDIILIDGKPADFSTLLRGGERVAVYPAFTNLDVDPEHRLLPPRPVVYRFVLDVHLGRLARYLRLAGFDTLYSNTYTDPEIAGIAAREERIVLTRDTGLLKHSAVARGYWLRSTSPRAQLTEVVERFDLHPHFTPFSRCMMCNGRVRAADFSEVRGRVPPRVAQNFDRFRLCDDCGRVYWPGSHYEKLAALLEEQARTHQPESYSVGVREPSE
ncbi:MAG: Mut7-C ubiquitin/RNAse domain-containing protein [Gammaproteobacteria bacterium]|nr:Mut7-C ubiquitin/RNAse domain-containing protein [Gammaproteobacteria bacterium]